MTPTGKWLMEVLRASPRGKPLDAPAITVAKLVETTLPTIEGEAIKAAVEDHYPEASSYPDDSPRLDCSCGWNQDDSKLDWPDHILAAVSASTSAPSSDEPESQKP